MLLNVRIPCSVDMKHHPLIKRVMDYLHKAHGPACTACWMSANVVILAYIPFQVGGGEGQEHSAPEIPASTGQKRILLGIQRGDLLNQNQFFNLRQFILTSSSQDIRLRLSKYGVVKTFSVFLKKFPSSCSSIVSYHGGRVQSLLHSNFQLYSYSCLSVHFSPLK